MESPYITANGKEVQLKTQEELKAEFLEVKTKLDQQFADGLIDGVEYNRQLVELMVPKEYKPKPSKRRLIGPLIILMITITILAIPAAIYLNWRFYFQNTLTTTREPGYYSLLNSSIISEPIQIDIDGFTETGKYKGRDIEITYRAYYDISGKVTSVRDYWGFGAYDTLVPRDVCLVWGRTLDAYNRGEVDFSQGTRNCGPKIDGVEVDDLDLARAKGVFGNTLYILYGFSNNHVISSTPEVRNQVLNLKKGDSVRLVGYLVSVSYDDIILSSSMTRNDFGDGACEVFYVTKIETF